ncbi:MAG: hypothetical protein ACLPKE_30215, partial [Streptosporangiaceae bacterium]
ARSSSSWTSPHAPSSAASYPAAEAPARRAEAALIIHDYIEGFHEGVEEGYVFPAAVGGSHHGRSEIDLT